MPAGWDRFVAKRNHALGTTYYGYDLIDQGVAAAVGEDPQELRHDLLAGEALGFMRDAPADAAVVPAVHPTGPARARGFPHPVTAGRSPAGPSRAVPAA